jgi:hypothetical protein
VSAFTGPLTITHVDVDWRLWILEQPLCYEVGEEGSGRTITAPTGFRTDGASVPRFLWAVLPTWGSYSRAAVIHDYLLDCLASGKPHPEAPTRADADHVFREAMIVCGVPPLLRGLLSFGVWLGSLTAR